MVDKDLSFPKGDQPEYSSEVGSDNTTDDNVNIGFQDYSVDDIYFYLYSRETPLDTLGHLGRTFESVISDRKNLDIIEADSEVGNIIPPTLSSVKDAEIRSNALRTISNLKKGGRPADAEAVINAVMLNMGVPEEIVRDVFDKFSIGDYIESELLNEENSALRGKTSTVPISVLSSIRDVLHSDECKKYKGKLKGRLFAKNILKNPKMTYRNMKRKLNTLNNCDSDLSYRLYGGDQMKKFLQDTLKMWREGERLGKKALKDIGFTNAFIKPHEKSSFGKRNEAVYKDDYVEEGEQSEFFGYTDIKPMENLLDSMSERELRDFLIRRDFMNEKVVREMSKLSEYTHDSIKGAITEAGYAIYKPQESGKYKVFMPKRCWRDKLEDGSYIVGERSGFIEYR